MASNIRARRIKTVADYIEWIDNLNDELNTVESGDEPLIVLYRGQRGHVHKPKPSVGRDVDDDADISRLEMKEKSSLRDFQRHLHEYRNPPRTRIEAMSIAQHYGLRTRLLDWSSSPLIALYFAVQKKQKPNEDPDNAVVYALYLPRESWLYGNDVEDRSAPEGDPFHERFPWNEGIVGFAPTAIDRRITAQQSYFTVHEDPRATLIQTRISDGRVAVAIADEKSRATIRQSLQRYGINDSLVFPETKGLAEHLDRIHFKA